MDDYSQAAEEFKESLIREYLRKNPNVKRHEIITRTVNGRIVIDTVDKVFKRAAEKRKVEQTVDHQKLKELMDRGDNRVAACLESINTSRKYGQWLYRSKFTNFGEEERNRLNEFLTKKEEEAANCALKANESKKKLIKILRVKLKATSSLVRTVLQETLEAVSDLLKCQTSVFLREVNLGDNVSHSMQDFIRSCATAAQALVKPSTINAMARAYSILENQEIDASKITEVSSLKKLKVAVDDLESQLQNRKEQIQAIQQLLQFVENVLEAAKSMPTIKKDSTEKASTEEKKETTEPTAKSQPPLPTPKTSKENEKKDDQWKRMAFTTKTPGKRK